MIRHKATGEFMPELKRTRGYSHWNPAKVDTATHLGRRKLLGVPRLFPFRKNAFRSIVQWSCYPNGKTNSHQTYFGEYKEDIDIKPDGRTKADLEIVIVNIEETGVITS